MIFLRPQSDENNWLKESQKAEQATFEATRREKEAEISNVKI